MITLFCMLAFLIRGGLTMWTVFDGYLNWYWWMDGVYYFFLEVIPVTSMLFVYVSPRRSSENISDPLLDSSILE